MAELSATDIALLEKIAEMEAGLAEGAVNIRKDSGCAERVSTEVRTLGNPAVCSRGSTFRSCLSSEVPRME